MSLFNDPINEMMDRLNKIMWFSSSTEEFDYILVRGSRISTDYDAADLIILQTLLINLGNERGYNVGWIEDNKSFIRNVKWALKWANEKNNALFFKYKPSNDAFNAYYSFEHSKHAYIREPSDKNLDILFDEFEKLYDILGN